MRFISAQPHDNYFVWQIEVQIVNFRKFGISDKMHVLVWYPNPLHNPDKHNLLPWKELEKKYPEVQFFYYQDKGLTLEEFRLYIPQLRPQILAKHFDNFPHLKDEVIFYHDSDIIFNYLPDFTLLAEEEVNWQSDTSGYLDYNYLLSKHKQGNIPDNEGIKKLAEIGGITEDVFKSYTGKTGGAQYILKGIDGDFWRDVERMCIQIRRAFTHGQPDSINTRYFTNESAGFQSWCADMWAVNMALWSRGKITDITSQLDFSWATDNKDAYLRKPIFHNAGATSQSVGIFNKSKWMNQSPIGKAHKVKEDSASYYYVKAIMDVK